MTSNAEKFPHYYKDVSHLNSIDVYRILQLFEVTDPCLQHAIKKLLAAGRRGAKDMAKDVHEAIVTLERWHDIRHEDLKPVVTVTRDQGVVTLTREQAAEEVGAYIAREKELMVDMVKAQS